MYGQVSQNDCSLALYTSAAWPVLDSSAPYSPELPVSCPSHQMMIVLIKGAVKTMPLHSFPC